MYRYVVYMIVYILLQMLSGIQTIEDDEHIHFKVHMPQIIKTKLRQFHPISKQQQQQQQQSSKTFSASSPTSTATQLERGHLKWQQQQDFDKYFSLLSSTSPQHLQSTSTILREKLPLAGDIPDIETLYLTETKDTNSNNNHGRSLRQPHLLLSNHKYLFENLNSQIREQQTRSPLATALQDEPNPNHKYKLKRLKAFNKRTKSLHKQLQDVRENISNKQHSSELPDKLNPNQNQNQNQNHNLDMEDNMLTTGKANKEQNDYWSPIIPIYIPDYIRPLAQQLNVDNNNNNNNNNDHWQHYLHRLQQENDKAVISKHLPVLSAIPYNTTKDMLHLPLTGLSQQEGQQLLHRNKDLIQQKSISNNNEFYKTSNEPTSYQWMQLQQYYNRLPLSIRNQAGLSALLES